jgi:hypothetical protein
MWIVVVYQRLDLLLISLSHRLTATHAVKANTHAVEAPSENWVLLLSSTTTGSIHFIL